MISLKRGIFLSHELKIENYGEQRTIYDRSRVHYAFIFKTGKVCTVLKTGEIHFREILEIMCKELLMLLLYLNRFNINNILSSSMLHVHLIFCTAFQIK